jgi:acyl-ACP thioesterase
MPVWGDAFTIHTFPVGTDRILALREFSILNEAGEQVGCATSGWLVVEAGRNRPVRPQPLVADLTVSAPSYPGSTDKLAACTGGHLHGPYPVRLHDIDQYRHVNNTAYLEWVLDCVEDDGLTPGRIGGLEIDFLQETVLSDRYVIQLQKNADAINAEVRRVRDDTPCCRCRIT